MLGWRTGVTDFLRNTPPARAVSLEAPGKGIKSLIVPNYNAVVGYREVQGADSLHLATYHRLMERVMGATAPDRVPPFPDRNTIRLASPDHRVLDMLNARWVTTTPQAPLDSSRFRHALDAELTVWENSRAYGPAWVVGRSEQVADPNAAFDRLMEPGFDARSTALVETPPLPLDPAASAGTVRLTRSAPHVLALDVVSSGRGLVVLSEVAYPGWRATVNRRPAPILRANGVLRALVVPPGASQVVVRYEPASYQLGLYFTSWGIAVLCAISAYGFRRQPPELGVVPRA
jgi:hypothetical protein